MEDNKIINLEKTIVLPQKKTLKDVNFKQENYTSINHYKENLEMIYNGLSQIIDLYTNNTEFGYLDVLNACINSDHDNISYYKMIFVNNLIEFGQILISYKIQSEKYSKTPIFTKAQLEATGGQADTLFKLEKQKVMQDVAMQFQVSLNKLFDIIMYFIGIKSSKDEICEQISDIYINNIEQPTPENIAKQVILLAKDLINLVEGE